MLLFFLTLLHFLVEYATRGDVHEDSARRRPHLQKTIWPSEAMAAQEQTPACRASCSLGGKGRSSRHPPPPSPESPAETIPQRRADILAPVCHTVSYLRATSRPPPPLPTDFSTTTPRANITFEACASFRLTGCRSSGLILSK